VLLVNKDNQEILVELEMQVNQEIRDLREMVVPEETVVGVVMAELQVQQEMEEVLETQVVMLANLVDLGLPDLLVLLLVVVPVELVVEMVELVDLPVQ
jgi:hypothetical protein